ncbi:MAG TPA: aromatic-ring-hydroxylating dioxygenase subunit beta [Burkholderiaceae bacterium]|nr:aromatic-ring-hydroxylating dioxygenase subunit beta [Burkholderiaceae bacterium]
MDETSLMHVAQFVQYEAFLLDERRWDEWLDLYDPQAEYWVPMWDDDGEPTRDPQSELSLIYYPNRSGLEDRIFRIKSGNSAATIPLARTCHMRTPPVVERQESQLVARFNWTTHIVRLGESFTYFGRKTLYLAEAGASMKIARSYTLVQNEWVDRVIDIHYL